MMLAACPIMTANLARRQPRNRIDANSPLYGNALRRRYHLMMGEVAVRFPIANQVDYWPILSWYGRACWQVASRMRHEENWRRSYARYRSSASTSPHLMCASIVSAMQAPSASCCMQPDCSKLIIVCWRRPNEYACWDNSYVIRESCRVMS